jgi:hypothetical protein
MALPARSQVRAHWPGAQAAPVGLGDQLADHAARELASRREVPEGRARLEHGLAHPARRDRQDVADLLVGKPPQFAQHQR